MKSIFDPSLQNKDLSSKIVAGLERISEAFRVLLWEHSKVIGLSPIQIQILIFLSFHDEDLRNVSALAKEFNLTKPTISDAIRVMENKGLIEKIPSLIDKRAYSIIASKTGEEMVKETMDFAEPLKKATRNLGPDQQEYLFNAIVNLISQLNQSGILSVQRTCSNCRFYEKKSTNHYCNFLNKELLDKDIRIDCPEFEGKQ